jgi:hypothetical protein
MPDSALPHQPQSSGLGPGPIAGSVIGAVAALAVVVIGWMALKRRRQQKPTLAFEPAVLGLHMNPAHASAAVLATKSASAHYLYAALDLPSPEYVSAHTYGPTIINTLGTAPTAGNLLYHLDICDGPSYHIPLEREPSAPAYMVPFDSPVYAAEGHACGDTYVVPF